MKIANPRYIQNQGYSSLELEIDGRKTLIPLEQKPTLYEAGIIYVGLEDFLPEIEFQGTTLRGCSNDPEILRLYDEFGRASQRDDFQPDEIR